MEGDAKKKTDWEAEFSFKNVFLFLSIVLFFVTF